MIIREYKECVKPYLTIEETDMLLALIDRELVNPSLDVKHLVSLYEARRQIVEEYEDTVKNLEDYRKKNFENLNVVLTESN